MSSKFNNHRIWYFISAAKEDGKDSIDFYRPVSNLANNRYEELCDCLATMGYTVRNFTNPQGSSLAGLIIISGIQGVTT